MKDADFQGIMQGLDEARSIAKGQAVPGARVYSIRPVDVAAVRAKTKLSQVAFAQKIGVSPGTLRNWEQNRRSPEGPARVLLAMIERNPRIVEETLAAR